MKVKKFIAPTMPEVMKEVRKELGADAVILNSKVVHKGGFLGLFKKKNIEVIAALDPQPQKPQRENVQIEPKKYVKPIRPNESGQSSEKVLQEVRELKQWMVRHTPHLPNNGYPASLQVMYDLLVEQEIDFEIAKQLIDPIVTSLNNTVEDLSVEQAKSLLNSEMQRQLSTNNFEGISYHNKIVHLVGPTGVGKTTTIAKLAANSVLKDNKKVALITTDTYRIAAIDQLKTYAKILNIPLEIAYSLEDYQRACKKFDDYDLILVDTAGRNYKDQTYVEQLKKIVDLENDIDTYLVLSLTTRTKDLEDIFQQFIDIPIKQLIFTKKDETSIYGPVLNLCLKNQIGVAYMTDGQDVPDDIKQISVDKICEMIVGEHADE